MQVDHVGAKAVDTDVSEQAPLQVHKPGREEMPVKQMKHQTAQGEAREGQSVAES